MSLPLPHLSLSPSPPHPTSLSHSLSDSTLPPTLSLYLSLPSLVSDSPPPPPISPPPFPRPLAVDNADREHEEKCHDYRENGVFGKNESKYYNHVYISSTCARIMHQASIWNINSPLHVLI